MPMSNANIERRKSALLESLSLYEQHCGAHGGESIMRKVRALQAELAESLADEPADVDTGLPARAA